jgi:hypothetical protein
MTYQIKLLLRINTSKKAGLANIMKIARTTSIKEANMASFFQKLSVGLASLANSCYES